MSTQINAYLTFDGNCSEAMTFYKECFGGELMMQKVGETPVCDEMPPDSHDKIMHAFLKNNDLILMASDRMQEDPLVRGNTITLSINCESDEQINDLFAKLSAGGKVVMPLADQFWGAKFGVLTDKYGMDWMLNFQKEKTTE